MRARLASMLSAGLVGETTAVRHGEPRPPMGKPPSTLRTGKDLADDCLESYFRACDSALAQSKGRSVGLDGFTDHDATQQARRVWTMLSTARVFVVDPIDYAKAYRAADEQTCGWAGLTWDGVPASRDEYEHLLGVYLDESVKVPFPDPLPFDSVFLGLGKQLALTEEQTAYRITAESMRGIGVKRAQLLGFVMGTCGDRREVYAVIDFEATRLSGVGFVCTHANMRTLPGYGKDDWPSDWLQPGNLDPWVLTALVKAINDRKSVTVEQPGLGAKMTRKAVMKRSGGATLPLPRPYYVVHVADAVQQVRQQAALLPPPSVAYSHRWDVRGHDCVRVARGKLPVDPETSVRLRKRGYVMYDVQPIADAHREILDKRGIRRGPDEWLAVLVYRRDAYVKGPASAPYVPATRVLV